MEYNRENEIYVKTFGKFGIYRAGQRLPEGVAGKGQVLRLFLTLICEDEQKIGIRREKLLEYLFERRDLDCANALRITVTRLRKQLEGTPELSELSVFYGGGWYWIESGSVAILTDGQEMERLYDEAREELNEEKKLNLLLKACQMYTGEFLPDMSGENWVEVRRSSYQELYVSCAGAAAELLEKMERFEELLNLCADVLRVYSDEEWEVRRIESLLSLHRYREARKAYHSAAETLFDQYPSEVQMKNFRQMGVSIEEAEQGTEDVRESLLGEVEQHGAHYCTWPGFVDCFHMYLGMVNRGYVCGYLLVCTIFSRQGKGVESDSDIRYYSRILCDLLHRQLRRGDSYTVHSPGRIMLLLSGVDKKGMETVLKRIKGGFWQETGQKAAVRIRVFCMSELSEQAEAKQIIDTEI